MTIAAATSMLHCRAAEAVDLVLAGARVIDPAEGIDEPLDVTVEDGVITAIEPAREARSRLLLAPAFIDPHVHLRTPGREDEEDLDSGTRAAAAGGYCALLGVPNTEPVVDNAAVLASLIERACTDAHIPVGFFAALSKGQRGEQLTDMAELAECGAVGFTDDGLPVREAGLMRRALQYSAVCDRPLALHEEEPSLSNGGHMHEGAVSAELGIGGWPSIAESTMVARDLGLARHENRPVHLMHLSARESVEELRRAQFDGVLATGEASPHHLCMTDESLRTLDPNLKMNPPLRTEADRLALVDALRDGTIGAVATDHAPHAAHEKDVPFEAAPFGVTGLETAFAALYTRLVLTGEIELPILLERMSAGPARIFGLPEPRVAIGERANLTLIDIDAVWPVEEAGFQSRSTNSWVLGERLAGKVLMTIADGRLVHAV